MAFESAVVGRETAVTEITVTNPGSSKLVINLMRKETTIPRGL